jgi:CBS domain-containing protein
VQRRNARSNGKTIDLHQTQMKSRHHNFAGDTPMKTGWIMTRQVVSVGPDASILDAARLMFQNNISGLPVVDANGSLVGIVSEGDFLRRTEIGTERKRSRWLEVFARSGQLAEEYARSHGRRIEDIMTPDPATVTEDTPLDEAVELMERRRIKRLPVVRGRQVVGMLSRADLMHALASLVRETLPPTNDDAEIQHRVLAELDRLPWAKRVKVNIRNGVVQLFGSLSDLRERRGVRVAVENVPGVTGIEDRMVLVELLVEDLFEKPKTRSERTIAEKP